MDQQAVPRYKIVWNGDVWKAIVNFRSRKEYDIVTCNIDHGVSLIKKKQNKDLLQIQIKDFKKLKFKDFYENYNRYMRIMNYENILDFLD